jgi:iron complex outermembrane receptor protein
MIAISGVSVSALIIALGVWDVAAAQAAPTQPAPTQPASSSASSSSVVGLPEVVVTAQRRSESLQKTALAISVVQPTTLANAGVTSPLQLTSVVPSLQIGNSGPASTTYLRGVGSFASTAAQSPAIPYYIDGVYIARTQSVESEFYDIDRLEVLKGPQGTLYGRNASGGAINILTVDPALGRYSATANVEVGNYSNENGDVAVNIPIGDTMAIRVSGEVVDKGGYTSVGLGDDVHQSGRIKFLWKPNDKLSLLLNASYGHIGGEGAAWVILNKDVPGWYPWLDASDPRSRNYQVTHSVFGPVAPPGFVNAPTTNEARQDLDFYNISATLNWDPGPFEFTLIPAFRYSSMQYSALFSFLLEDGYGLGDQPARPQTSKASSVEARFSKSTDRLKWVGGLFFYNEDQFEQYTIDGGYAENVGINSTYGTRSYAAYGQATYSVTDHFRLTGGLRYTIDRRSLEDGQSYVLSPTVFLGPPPGAAIPCNYPITTQAECLVDSYSGEKTYYNVSWKGGFEADVFQNSLLYATASKGFKAGGFNNQSVVGSPGAAQAFLPETLTSYDVGLKNRFFDNRLQLNLAGFFWDYDNHQEPKITLTNSGTTNLVYFNAGAAHIYGGDLEAIYRPWANATINSSVEYAHSRYEQFSYDIPAATYSPLTTGCPGSPSTTSPDSITLNCSGRQVARTPDWSGAFGFTQAVDVGAGRLTGTSTVTYASARWLGTDFTPIEHAAGYASLDLSLTYQPPSRNWSLTGFVRNVNNAAIYTQAQENAFAYVTVANIQPPRTYGGRLSVHF